MGNHISDTLVGACIRDRMLHATGDERLLACEGLLESASGRGIKTGRRLDAACHIECHSHGDDPRGNGNRLCRSCSLLVGEFTPPAEERTVNRTYFTRLKGVKAQEGCSS